MMRNAALQVIVVAVALALTGDLAASQEIKGGAYTKIPTVKGIETLKPGTPAPDFKVKDLADNEFHLKECRDKEAVLLFFWSFFCGPCREEIPMINEMMTKYKDRGLHVVGVNLDGREMKKAIDNFVKNEKIRFQIVFDELVGDAFVVADPYGVAGTPALFLVDRKGTVAFSAVGAVKADQLMKDIEKITKAK